MEYRKIDDHARFISCSGSPVKVEYFKQIDDDGREFLKECGKTDLYGEIQSHKDSVDINIILARYAAGDVMALQKRQAMFGDFSDAPKSLVEVIQLVNEAERAFMELPVSVRQEFDNSVAIWLAQYGNDRWLELMGIQNTVEEPVKEEKVNDPE